MWYAGCHSSQSVDGVGRHAAVWVLVRLPCSRWYHVLWSSAEVTGGQLIAGAGRYELSDISDRSRLPTVSDGRPLRSRSLQFSFEAQQPARPVALGGKSCCRRSRGGKITLRCPRTSLGVKKWHAIADTISLLLESAAEHESKNPALYPR